MTSGSLDDAPDGTAARDAVARFASTRHAGGDWTAPHRDELDGLAEVAALWRSLDGIADDPAVAAMRADARGRIAPAPHPLVRYGFAAVAAAVVIATVGTLSVGSRYLRHEVPPAAVADRGRIIDNPRGPPHTIALADGSSVTLDTESRVRVYEASGTRHAALERGRAFFSVRHDPRRPFQVDLGVNRITDIGTTFEVSMIGDAPSVTLIDGAVRVEAPGAAPQNMTPGSRLLLRPGSWALVPVDGARRTEWRHAVISVDDRPLDEVVATMNRYLAAPLIVTDPGVAKVRISGTFQLDDPDGFARALSAMGYDHAVQAR